MVNKSMTVLYLNCVITKCVIKLLHYIKNVLKLGILVSLLIFLNMILIKIILLIASKCSSGSDLTADSQQFDQDLCSLSWPF